MILAAETNLQFSYFQWNYDRAKVKGMHPQVTVENPAGESIATLGAPASVYKSTENTLQLQEKVKWFVQNHKIKAGIEVTSSFFDRYIAGQVGVS